MRDVTKPSDLDALSAESYGVETLNKLAQSMPLYGLKPYHRSTYRKACEEGWAPAPTNDVQRKIWNEVRTLPDQPIEIKP